MLRYTALRYAHQPTLSGLVGITVLYLGRGDFNIYFFEIIFLFYKYDYIIIGMVRYYNILEEYFLSVYDDFPLEIRKKMKNLLFINILNLLGWFFIFFIDGVLRYLNNFDFITFFRDFIVLGLIIFSMVLIKVKKPIFAGYMAMTIVISLAIHPILMDLIGSYSLSEYMLYRTLGFLIIGELLISAYAIKRIQILIYSIISFILLSVHFRILMINFFGGNVPYDSYAMIFESVFLLTSSTTISFFLFNLTLRSRMEIIKNMVFFKLSKKGPIPFFSEHSIDYNSLIESGVYFYTAIGQGNQYRTGLFGPLPFGNEEEKIALIFSSIVKDSEFEDPRLKGKNYMIVSLIVDVDKVDLIDRNKLLNLLEDNKKSINDLSEFNEEDIEEFIRNIREH
ncbi:MAG: hypothetical protein EU547_00575 [Promethearchaeota archaeon]|nr:MAG: hypothetical protein EU547_00575 [Candidatus Lokiarchaeota archaeon]